MNRNIIIVLVGWGIWSFLEKLAVEKIHPAQIQIINCIIGIFLIPIYWSALKINNVKQPINFSGVAYTVAASLCATIASYVFIRTLKTTDVGAATILGSTYPIITLILSAILLGEAITVPKIIGIALILSGAVFLGH